MLTLGKKEGAWRHHGSGGREAGPAGMDWWIMDWISGPRPQCLAPAAFSLAPSAPFSPFRGPLRQSALSPTPQALGSRWRTQLVQGDPARAGYDSRRWESWGMGAMVACRRS